MNNIFDFDALLQKDERLIRDTVRNFIDRELTPENY